MDKLTKRFLAWSEANQRKNEKNLKWTSVFGRQKLVSTPIRQIRACCDPLPLGIKKLRKIVYNKQELKASTAPYIVPKTSAQSNFFKMPSVLEEKMTKGTNKKNVFGFYFLSTCAVTGLFTSCYLYFTYIVAEAFYSRKYMWNFSVTMALYVFIFIGKLFRYRLTDTSRRSTFITLIQFDSMCLALAGLGMAITNYHYDRSGLYGNKYLQTVAKLLVAKKSS
uniref:Uncharacterized protein n=1 Tax=Magallana gigas TaxID=29159 RepID=K1QKD5_MAGGI